MIGVTATKAHRRTPEPQAERKKKSTSHSVWTFTSRRQTV